MVRTGVKEAGCGDLTANAETANVLDADPDSVAVDA